jgi:hypothetical protein
VFTVTNSPVTSTGTLTLSYSGTALPPANGGTGLTAVGTTGNVLTSDGTAWVSSPVTIPTSGGVGTIIFAQYGLPIDIGFGTTTAASNLSYANAGGSASGGPSSGTWKCLGFAAGSSVSVGAYTTTLWIRTI